MPVLNHRDPDSGPGLFEITSGHLHQDDDGRWHAVSQFRELVGKHRRPGSVLIGWAGWLLAALAAGLLFVSFAGQYKFIFAARQQKIASIIEALMLDAGMIIFSLLALGLARSGKPARTERVLILACAAASAGMNYAAADDASPRSVIAFTAAPVFLAVVVDRVIAVIRRHVLGDDETSPWTLVGRALRRAACAVGLAALIFVFWGRPTLGVVIGIVVVLLVVLGLIELIGRPPARTEVAGQP